MAITNTFGKIASLRPANTDEAQLYTVPAATEVNGVLRVCNQDSVARTCRVAHTDTGHGAGAAGNDDWLWYDKEIPANDTIEVTIHATPTQTIRVKASAADVISFHLSGQLKVTS